MESQPTKWLVENILAPRERTQQAAVSVDQPTLQEFQRSQDTQEETHSGNIEGEPMEADAGNVSSSEADKTRVSDDSVRGHPDKDDRVIASAEQETILSTSVGTNLTDSEPRKPDESCEGMKLYATSDPVTSYNNSSDPCGDKGNDNEAIGMGLLSGETGINLSKEADHGCRGVDNERSRSSISTSDTAGQLTKPVSEEAPENDGKVVDLSKKTMEKVGGTSLTDDGKEGAVVLDGSVAGSEMVSPNEKELLDSSCQVVRKAGESPMEQEVTESICETSENLNVGECDTSPVETQGTMGAPTNLETDEPMTATGICGDSHKEEGDSSHQGNVTADEQGGAGEEEDPEKLVKTTEGEDKGKDEAENTENGKTEEKEEGNAEEESEPNKKDEDDDNNDDDDDEDSSADKKRISRASPIRCFDESIFTVEKLFEYQWPQSHGEYFFVQEQISEYLAVTSFKRKYPALERRLIGMEERRFLRDKAVVTEEQVTLGLTALKADEVYDVMQKDFPAKYSAYARLIQQRQREAIKNKHKEYGTPAVDGAKMKNYIKNAVRQAAEYNAQLMRQRREERQYYLDLQTMLIHCPQNKMKRLTKEQSKPGPYPVAVIPGQYQNYYKSYTPQELKYMPVNTALYGPIATQKQSDIGPNIPPEDEVSSDEEDLSLAVIEPPFDHERINPAFFKEQVRSVLPEPPRDVPMIPLQPPPLMMVSHAPPPPVTQVLSQLLQQKGMVQPKPPVYLPKVIPDAICGLCLNDKDSNRKGEHEELVHCSQCDNSGHPSCLEMSPDLVRAIKTYPWQCMECKTCTLCGDPTHEDMMMFCDECDRGYHTFCVGLTDLPTGLWACASCRCVPPAQPLPPPPIVAPVAIANLTTIPPPVNGSPESTTAPISVALETPSGKNGTKRPAEPIVVEESNMDGKTVIEPGQVPTPPPSKKRNSKKKQATPAKS